MSQNDFASYGFTLDKAQAGQKTDLRPDTVLSRAAEGEVPFGHAVTFGTDPEKQCEVVDADTDVFLGVALFTHGVENPLHNGTLGGDALYADTASVSVLRKGSVWVQVTEAVEAGDAAFVNVQDTDIGLFCKTEMGNVATGGVFMSAADAGELAQLEI